MIRRDDIELLKTKRHEIGNVVASRKRKLRELYCATTSLQESEDQNRDNTTTTTPKCSIDSWLGLNEVAKGIRFTVKSLAQIYNASIPGLSTARLASDTGQNDDEVSDNLQDGNVAAEGGLDGVVNQKGDNLPTNHSMDQLEKTLEQRTRKSSLDDPEDVRGSPAQSSPTQYSLASTNPASQLLSEAAREETTIPSQTMAGVKRDYSTLEEDSPELMPPKRRKEEGRQPIRIDTNLQKRLSFSILTDSPAPYTAVTPSRMTTRVASGAIRQRSVSEITGETPRVPLHKEHSHGTDAGSQTPKTGVPPAASPSALFSAKLNDLRDKDKDRSKMSTVVFPKPPSVVTKPPDTRPEEVRRRERILEQKDYLEPLFYAQAVAQTPKLSQLVTSAKKTLSSADHRIEYQEDQTCRVLKRIYHLQNSNRWSLRQLSRCKEPDRPMSHWDCVLREAKWMRTDFREERRWKLVLAKNLADWCSEYVNSTEDERAELRVKIRKAERPPSAVANQTTPMSLPNTSGIPPSDVTPDLLPSTVDDVSDLIDDEPTLDELPTLAPSALFLLPPTDLTFGVRYTPAAERMLDELPMYHLFNDTSGDSKHDSFPLDTWKTPIAPVTKFATAKLSLQKTGPILRRSRYKYAQEDQDDNAPVADHEREILKPEQTDVALFEPENKHIVQRLHAAHTFRPPSEFQMPSQGFFESRLASRWTPQEDNQLRRLVQEYEYNWSLVSKRMSSPSMLTSGADRRTPWECFERWVSFEGLPGDMAKHQYFKAWNSRREEARKRIEQVNEASSLNPATAQLASKRKMGEPISVERKPQNKWFSLLMIISKVVRQREITANKRAENAAKTPKQATTDPVEHNRGTLRTPRDFSLHRHKQEVLFRDNRIQVQNRAIAQYRAALANRQAQANGTAQPGVASQTQGGASQQNRMAVMHANAMRVAAATAAAGGRSMQGAISGVPSGQAGQLTPQQMAQAAAFMQAQHPRLASQNDPSRVMLEAARLSEQQRQAQQRQFQNGTANMNYANNAMFAGVPANGQKSPAANGVPAGNRSSSSPASANGIPVPPGSSIASHLPMVNQLVNNLKAQNPNLTPEQVTAMATQALSKSLRQQQNSMAVNGNAAMLGQMAMAANGGVNTQMYQQLLRSQQLQQAGQPNRPVSTGRSGSPNDASRPGSQGGVMMQKQGSSMSAAAAATTTQSPRPPSANMAGSS